MSKRITITGAFLIIFFMGMLQSLYGIVYNRETDSLALVALYDSTDGDNWSTNTNWKTAEPIDNWYRVTVTDNRVTQLNSQMNNLTGSIPDEIGNLTGLNYLSFYVNDLSGEIPESIGNLTELTSLYISHNNLTGEIPTSIVNLTKLKQLYLNSNDLTGPMPGDIGNLVDLEYFSLFANSLSGTLPTSFGSLTKLKEIIFYGNDFTGPLPAGIVNSIDLVLLDINNCALTGSIPAEIGNLTKLDRLSLSNNELTGSIPTSIVNLSDLSTLSLSSNNLTGDIPKEIGNLTNLTYMTLNNNELSGQIPESIGNLTEMTTFNFSQNQLTDSLPGSFANLTKLQYLYIDYNDLSDLPDLTNITTLVRLKTQRNQFTFEDIEPNIGVTDDFQYSPQDRVGEEMDTTITIGDDIDLFVDVGGTANQYQWYKDNVSIVDATSSHLLISTAAEADSGTYVCYITNTIATELTLASNLIKLTVVIPPRELDSLALVALYDSTNGDSWNTNTNWKTAEPLDNWYKVKMLNGRVDELNLGGNNLVGVIPDEIGNLTAITYLALVANSLTGPIPTAIGNLTNLETLSFGSNPLTGTIPEEIYDLTKLTSLSFQNNYGMEGTISSKIGQLTDLETLSFESMSLEGPIPDEICTLTNLWSLKLGNNQNISGTIPANIGNLVNLKYLSVYNNSLTGSIPDGIGDLVNLEKLVFSGNDMTGSIPEFIGNLVNLTELQFSKNEFTGTVPDTLNSLTAVIYLALNHNAFDELNSLSGMSALNTLSIYNNKFTFEDIEPNIGVPATNFYYSPQDTVGEKVDTTITEGDELVLSVTVGGEHNVYQWKLDGTEISGANSDTYTIATAALADSGTYTCEITNTVATELTLFSYPMMVTVNAATDINEGEGILPKSFALYQNYPNPFNPTTTIKYDLPKASEVSVKIYNVFGQEVKKLVSGMQTAGRKNVIWNGRDEIGNQVASGIYFYQISSTSFNKTMKMILIK